MSVKKSSKFDDKKYNNVKQSLGVWGCSYKTSGISLWLIWKASLTTNTWESDYCLTR